MKWIVLGDMHGEYDALLAASRLAEAGTHKVLSLGDLLDSYHRPAPDQARCIDKLLRMVKAEQAVYVMGNHEASYLYPSMRCGGWNQPTWGATEQYFTDMKRFMRPLVFDEAHKVLFIHGGVTKGFLEQTGITSLENLGVELEAMAGSLSSPFYQIGHIRGGPAPFGGPLWCDWNYEFTPIPGLTQVVGHTNYQGRKRFPGETRIGELRVITDHLGGLNYNIDCLSRSYDCLEYDDVVGSLRPAKFVSLDEGETWLEYLNEPAG